MSKPVVAITMGDPAGVGPEVVVKALKDPKVRDACRPLVVGDLSVLERAMEPGKRYPWRWAVWVKGAPLARTGADLPIYPVTSLKAHACRAGSPSRAGGEAAYRYIRESFELVRSGVANAIATAPISKSGLHLAGHLYPGHTELLAELAGAKAARMMLVGTELKVVLVTVHLRLASVARELTRERVRLTLELTHQALRRHFGIRRPRLAVAALNPHAGEEGIFGREERAIILPAVQSARRKGIDARGPLAADSLFHARARKSYDACVCMYHDQGLIPLKLLHFFDGAALTLGLPFVRTSVDHGTAYDIAGKNLADGSSMKAAILLAARLARRNLSGKVRP